MGQARTGAENIEILGLEDSAWTAFVAGHPDATPFHQPAWARLLADCYRFRAKVAVLPDTNGHLAAGLPVIELGCSSRRRWVSLPFTDRCPPLARPDLSERELVDTLEHARGRLGLRALEVHDRLDGGWSIPQGYWHELSLDRSPDELRAGLHKSRAQMVRRAEREGIVVERGQSSEDLCGVFYRLHVLTRRRLGVPVQPKRFFELLWERMLGPGLGFVLTARLRGTPIASSVFLSSGRRVTYKFSASDRGPLGAPDAVLWTAIEQSCRDGASTFDFGRTGTGNEGLRQFKLRWGAREEPLAYTVLAADAPASGGGRATAAVAPVIRRSPPWVTRAVGALAYRFTA